MWIDMKYYFKVLACLCWLLFLFCAEYLHWRQNLSVGNFVFSLLSFYYFSCDIIKRKKGTFITKFSFSLAMLLLKTHGCFFCQTQQLKPVKKGYLCQSTNLWVLNDCNGRVMWRVFEVSPLTHLRDCFWESSHWFSRHFRPLGSE